MKVYIGCDHGGFDLKQKIIEWFEGKGLTYEDVGCYSAESCHYPDYAHKVAEAVQKGEDDIGILICGTGQGMAMTANKYSGIRAAVCNSDYLVRMAKGHNNANILCLGARGIDGNGLSPEDAYRMIDTFLSTEFEGGRHQRRIDMIER